MPDSQEPPPDKPRKKRRRWKRWTLLLLVVGLVLLDGPGWRWIASRVAGYYLPELGLSGTVEFQGRLTGGEVVLKGNLTGEGAVRSVQLDQIVVRYRPGRIFRGEIEAVQIDGLHAQLDLDRPWPGAKPKSGPDKPTDLTKVAENLRKLRARFVPVEADVNDLQVLVTRGETPLFRLATMDVSHAADADRIDLKIGELTFPGNRILPAQSTSVVWTNDSLSLEKALLAPQLALEGVKVDLPASGNLAWRGGVLLNDARFETNGTLEEGSIRMAAGNLVASEVAETLGVNIPAQGILDSFQATVRDIPGGIRTLDATASATLREVVYQDWNVPSVKLDLDLNDSDVKLKVDGTALDSPVTLDATAKLRRETGFVPERAEVSFSIPRAEAVVAALRPRMKALEDPADFPASSLSGIATAAFSEGKITGAEAHAVLSPAAPAEVSPLDLTASWVPAGRVEAKLIVDGARVDASADTAAKRYSGRAAFEDFTPDRLRGWLAAFSMQIPSGMRVRGTWQGEGAFGPTDHRGRAEITRFAADQISGGPAVVSGGIDYAWPRMVEIRGLTAEQGPAKIVCNARLADQLLTLQQLQWTDHGEVMLDGTASVPLSENPGDWRGLLKQTRPLAIDIESRELALSKLHPFLPPSSRFTEGTRGKLTLHLAGTPAAPTIDATLTVRDIGLQSQAKVPKADLELRMKTGETRLNVEGTLVTPGYPAANLTASLPFRPGVWVENPGLIQSEPLEAAARVPNLDLSRFANLVPALKTLTGSLKADLTVGGTIGKPEPQGALELKNGTVVLKNEQVEPLNAINISAKATPSGITLDRLALQMEAGTIDGRGRLTLADGKPGTLDFTLRGRSLPLKRDDSMIIRANADLTLRGPWERATLGGTVAIVDSLYYRDIELIPIGVPFNQPSAPSLPAIDTTKRANAAATMPEPFRDWPLAVKVKTANAFLIRGNLATGQATLDVDLGGTLGSPAPRGKALLREVVAKLPFSSLTVEEGTVDFRPDAPFEPTLNIRGRSTVRPYEVELYVYGPVTDPKVLTTSSPPLPESEIMTLLATGTTTSGIADPQAAMTRGAQLLIEELRRGRIRYARRLQPVLKVLDKVDFQIGEQNRFSGEKYNSATINLDDNWLLSTGVGEEGNSRVTLMYLVRFR